MLKKIYKELCEPSKLYFVVSMIIILVVAFQNFLNENSREYCIGPYTCPINHNGYVFVSKLLYILFMNKPEDTDDISKKSIQDSRIGFNKIDELLSPDAHNIINSLSVLILFIQTRTARNRDTGIVTVVIFGINMTM